MTIDDVKTIGLSGNEGSESSRNCATVALCYDSSTGWYITADTRQLGDAVPADEWHGILRHYELARGDLAVLRDEDAPRFLKPLGDGLTTLLTRISGGYAVDWDGNNHVGHLNADAGDAEEELHSRILDAKCDLPETWLASDWVNEYVEESDTAEDLMGEAESQGIRIWGGLEAMNAAIKSRREIESGS